MHYFDENLSELLFQYPSHMNLPEIFTQRSEAQAHLKIAERDYALQNFWVRFENVNSN